MKVYRIFAYLIAIEVVVQAAAIAFAVFGLVVLQVFLGLLSLDAVGLGLLHGINAFALLAAAVTAGRRAATVSAPARESIVV